MRPPSTSEAPPPEESLLRPGRWLVVAIWGAQLLVVWALGEFGCPDVPMGVVDVVNGVAIAGGAVGTWAAWSRFRWANGSTRAFLDRVAFYLAVVFLLAIVLTTVVAVPWSCR